MVMDQGAPAPATEEVSTVDVGAAADRGMVPVNRDTALTDAAEKGIKPLAERLGEAYDEAVTEASGDDAESGQPRDQLGKYAKKAGEVVEGAKPDAAVADPNAVAPVAEDAWQGWNDEWKGKFKALPPEQAKIVADSHKALSSFHQAREAKASQMLNEADGYYKQSAPFMQEIAKGQEYIERRSADTEQNPSAYIGNVLRNEATLAYGAIETKERIFWSMAQAYGLTHMIAGQDKGQRAQQREADPFADPAEQPQYDPRLVRENHDLKQKLAEYDHRFSRAEQQNKAQQTQKFSSAWDGFTKATDQSGQPLYPFADDVKVAMNRILERGEARTVQEAYAIAAKPMMDRVASLAKAQQDKADAERRTAIEKAKRAAPVKVSGMSRNGSTAPANWRDAISAAYDQ